jgi:hypothetical protein
MPNSTKIVLLLLGRDFKDSFSYGTTFMFCSALCEGLMKNKEFSPYHVDIAAIVLQSAFELIYGFSYATAGRTLVMYAADYFKFSPAHSALIGDITHSTISLVQDLTPIGMLRTTTYNFGKLCGYKTGLWAEKKLALSNEPAPQPCPLANQ